MKKSKEINSCFLQKSKEIESYLYFFTLLSFITPFQSIPKV